MWRVIIFPMPALLVFSIHFISTSNLRHHHRNIPRKDKLGIWKLAYKTQQLSFIIWSVAICWESICHALFKYKWHKVCSCVSRISLLEKNRLKIHEAIISRQWCANRWSADILNWMSEGSQRNRFLKAVGHSGKPWLSGKTLKSRAGPFRRKWLSCIWNISGEHWGDSGGCHLVSSPMKQMYNLS